MNVQLSPELERLVQSKIESGRYNSANDVVSDALRLLEEREIAVAEVRKKIAAGVASAKAGRMIDGEAFLAQMEAELDEEIRAEEEQAKQERASHR